MTRLRLLRNLRTAVYLVVCGVVITALGVLWWANHTGMPAAWRAAIEREFAKQGAHVAIGSLSYIPFQGIVASDVRVFSEAARTTEFARLERILIDVDKSKLPRGEFSITRVQVTDANLHLTIQPKDTAPEVLDITGLSGTFLIPGGRLMELRDAHAVVAGIDVTLGARLLKFRPTGAPPQEDTSADGRLKVISNLLKEMRNWRSDRTRPPALRVFLECDLSDWSTLTARLALTAHDVGKAGHVMNTVNVEGNLTSNVLSLAKVRAADSRGTLEGRLDYDLSDREGRFDFTSGVNVPDLLKCWLDQPLPQFITFGGSQRVEAEGDFKFDDKGLPQVRMTGRANCRSVMLRGVPFDTVEGAFAWQDGGLYLRDVALVRPDGKATGKAMIQWPLVRMALTTTLPIPVYRPFFVGQPLEPVLNSFGERPGAEVKVTLEGGFDATDPQSWAYTGSGRVKNVTYQGVPVDAAQCKLALSQHDLDFTEGSAVFNFKDYPLRKAFSGRETGTLTVARIRFDAPAGLVRVEDVEGSAWAAPVVRTFAPAIADTLEIYRFHEPPHLTASGVVDVTPQGRTALTVGFNSSEPAEYVFLEKNLVLNRPSGRVTIRGPEVLIEDLKVNTFDGPVTADIKVGEHQKITAEFSWTDLSMLPLAETYGFEMKGGGKFTGRIDCALTDGRIDTLSGSGLASLERSELFTAPIAGPLSPLIAAVAGKKAGFQKARDAFCTFEIADGILYTKDFHTSTNSLVFAGDGWVDMSKRELDMNIRVDARGLLGLVTLPLRPFAGFFQFRGTGPLGNPEWKKAGFTAPPPEQHDILDLPAKAREAAPPPRARVVGE